MPEKKFMLRAIELAKEAGQAGEVPVGAVVVKNGQIIGEGRNRREEKKSALYHAEAEAIAVACKYVNDWRLSDCDIYVTLEPCPMCAGAILNAQIERIVYGADDERAGACGTAVNLLKLEAFHRPELYRGFYETECRELLNEFFLRLRERQM